MSCFFNFRKNRAVLTPLLLPFLRFGEWVFPHIEVLLFQVTFAFYSGVQDFNLELGVET